ncbi:MAG: putative dsRNA-binding protein [Trueperaceae bacterium]|nr:putative dsRNA-binding protein [Trueperaceae bacterium]
MAHPKGVLIERLQKEGRQPRFEARMSGPDHEPEFEAEVRAGDEVLGRGRGANKRTAERLAAEEALRTLDAQDEAPGGTEAAASTAEPAPRAPEGFDGPWPLFEPILAATLRIAHERVAAGLATDEAREAIEAFSLELYKNVLLGLGEVVEED